MENILKIDTSTSIHTESAKDSHPNNEVRKKLSSIPHEAKFSPKQGYYSPRLWHEPMNKGNDQKVRDWCWHVALSYGTTPARRRRKDRWPITMRSRRQCQRVQHTRVEPVIRQDLLGDWLDKSTKNDRRAQNQGCLKHWGSWSQSKITTYYYLLLRPTREMQSSNWFDSEESKGTSIDEQLTIAL